MVYSGLKPHWCHRLITANWSCQGDRRQLKTRSQPMNSNKLTLVAILTVMILLWGRFTPAQTTDWSKANTAAVAASQRGEYALAQTFYKQAIEIQQKTLGADNP